VPGPLIHPSCMQSVAIPSTNLGSAHLNLLPKQCTRCQTQCTGDRSTPA
jgi:hypothetical protein